jgi:tRNA pseudouridine38-40 synthase
MRHLHLWQRGHFLDFWVEGDGFLYNMVRAFAGTLLDVGLGRYGPARVDGILAACDRRAAGATAPAHALYLVRVLYAEHLFAGNACETAGDTLPSAPSAEVE